MAGLEPQSQDSEWYSQFKLAYNLWIAGGPEEPKSGDDFHTLLYKIVANSFAIAQGGGGGGGGTIASTNSVLKGDNGGNAIAAVAGTDFLVEVVQDTTPQLGGPLDVNGQIITSSSNGNVVIDPSGTGNITLTSAEVRGNRASYIGYEWEVGYSRWLFRHPTNGDSGILFDLTGGNVSRLSLAHNPAGDYRTEITWDGTGGRSHLGSQADWRLAFAPASSCIFGTAGSPVYNAAFTEVVRFDTNGLAFSRGGIRRVISTKSAVYTILDTDDFIVADVSGGAFTVTLPTPVGRTGRVFTVKNINAGTNKVTVGTAAGLIDGAATKVYSSDNESNDFISDGTNWLIH